MGYRVVNPTAKKMIVTLSFTAYTAEAWLLENPEWGMIVITCLLPLDTRVRSIFESIEKAVFFESNYTGQLEEYMTKELGLKYIPALTIDHRRRYDLLPFYMEDFDSLK